MDFIIHSINHLLQKEFGLTLGSEGVHIIDPFTGTGTFITRLLQSGLITRAQLEHKYKNEIHANEIVLLAYYIAAINIEAVYHSIVGDSYAPFEGICLTDTFEMYEHDDILSAILVDNSERRKRQKSLDIRVIFGNPPYSVGQDSANDNNANISYPYLDKRIEDTYVEKSTATLSKSMYNSYIRAMRWASDRIGDSGVIGFITNAGFLESNTADGLRKSLAEEFSSIYVFHLKGSIRGKSGDAAKREGGNIFDILTGVAISILVKNPKMEAPGRIEFYEIDEYLSKNDKLRQLQGLKSIDGLVSRSLWKQVTPNQHGDWIRQRDDSFNSYIALGDKKGNGPKLFHNFSLGVATNRDAWCYNASKRALASNMKRMIEFYNKEAKRFDTMFAWADKKRRAQEVDGFIDTDASKISWTRSLKGDLVKGKRFEFDEKCIVQSLYRPFTKQWMYFNRTFNEICLLYTSDAADE